MRWLPRLVCQHNTIHLSRAHKDVCKEHHGKEAWVDIHGCYNFIVCQDCGKVLKAKMGNDQVYPTVPY